jgi:hypothetical protein
MNIQRNTLYKFNRHWSASLFTLMFACFLFFHSTVTAQNIAVTASLDTNKMLIGDQINLRLKAQAPIGTIIKFPRIADTLREHIDVVKQSNIDTSYSPDKQRFELTKTIVITSFDSGYYAIPPFDFYSNNDTLHALTTSALLLQVQTLAVDTTKAFRDIKPPLKAPFTWQEALPYAIGGLAIIALIAAAVYFLRKRKKVVNLQVKPKVLVPPHIEALELLQQLRDEKLWQNGFEKEYHIRISDIIRNYIERRFGLTALEQTTDEIMRHTRSIDLIDENLRFKLKQILSLSDMVKFAKELPLPNENEQSMENAILFVNSTVKIEIVNPETNEN